MAGRAPRPGACPGGVSRSGAPRQPAMTRTQLLRAAKNTAIVQKASRPDVTGRTSQQCPPAPRPRTGLARMGPPPSAPKRIDMAKPTMTKTMQLRQKAAAEKLARAEAMSQRRSEPDDRRPRRTAAPIGGDARLGHQRPSTSARRPPEVQIKALEDAIARGHVTAQRGRGKKTAAVDEAIARGHVVDRSRAKRSTSRGSRGPRPLATGTPIDNDARELARLMDAEVVEAVPLSDGPVDTIIIDPGVVRGDRSTIVHISPPGTSLAGESSGASMSETANRSLQVINETLDEQDAAESAAVQEKLEDLQQARREFVIAVANVGGNTFTVHDDSIINLDDVDDPLEYISSPPRPKRVHNVPDISHEMFQVQYGLDHPDVDAARQYSQRMQHELEQMDAQRRIEQDFEHYATQRAQDLDFDVPFEQDIQEGDISFEEDEHGDFMPCPSRIKASMQIPRRTSPCPPRGANIDELERFFDLQTYPPERSGSCPPPGRDGLNPDLWDVEDVWHFVEPPVEAPPLIRFDSCC